MFRKQWEFTPRNPANTAVIIQNEKARSRSVVAAGGSGGSTTAVICGSGGEGTSATANANVSCIVLGQDAVGNINTGQNSDGNQSSDANTQTAQHQSTADAVSEILNGPANGGM